MTGETRQPHPRTLRLLALHYLRRQSETSAGTADSERREGPARLPRTNLHWTPVTRETTTGTATAAGVPPAGRLPVRE